MSRARKPFTRKRVTGSPGYVLAVSLLCSWRFSGNGTRRDSSDASRSSRGRPKSGIKNASSRLCGSHLGLGLSISRLALAFQLELTHDRRRTGRTVLSRYREHRLSETERSPAFAA